MMSEEQQSPDAGLVIYQNQNSRPTVPIEPMTFLHPPAPPIPTPISGATQRLQSADFDRKSLPNRIQFLVRESGSILEKAARAPLIVGRHNSVMPVDIDLSDFNAHEMGISRTHFRVEPAPDGKLLVIDLKAANGTRLNGERLEPLRSYELRHGDEIQAGRIHLKVYFIY
jgi:hypothetical protein